MSHIPQLLSWPVTNQKRGPSDPQDLTSNFIVDTRMIALISLILFKRESSPGPCQPSILYPCHGIGAGCLGHRHDCRGEGEHGFILESSIPPRMQHGLSGFVAESISMSPAGEGGRQNGEGPFLPLLQARSGPRVRGPSPLPGQGKPAWWATWVRGVMTVGAGHRCKARLGARFMDPPLVPTMWTTSCASASSARRRSRPRGCSTSPTTSSSTAPSVRGCQSPSVTQNPSCNKITDTLRYINAVGTFCCTVEPTKCTKFR